MRIGQDFESVEEFEQFVYDYSVSNQLPLKEAISNLGLSVWGDQKILRLHCEGMQRQVIRCNSSINWSDCNHSVRGTWPLPSFGLCGAESCKHKEMVEKKNSFSPNERQGPNCQAIADFVGSKRERQVELSFCMANSKRGKCGLI